VITLERGFRDQIPISLIAIYDSVSHRIADEDGMYHGNAAHYLACGASAMNAISVAIALAHKQPTSFLDFGSGAGRVTRWLRAAYPDAHISATDLRPSDLDFCASEFDALTWVTDIDVDAMQAPATYDVIWVGSVLTHLSEKQSRRLVAKLISWLNPEGIVVLSLHGRFAYSRGPSFNNYGVDDHWPEIEKGYLAKNLWGYADYPNQIGYGISLTRLSWSARLGEEMQDTRLLLLSEIAWDGHHDILALQKLPVGLRLPILVL
jgi:SAM-dependent methyltransferase